MPGGLQGAPVPALARALLGLLVSLLALAALSSAVVALAPGGPAVGPALAAAAECNGDECEAPPPAPEDPTPGTAVVEGPANPPVRFPKPHSGKHHGKKHHHRRGARHRGNG
jgi:hypothetical protein